jgi:hypothetical protein
MRITETFLRRLIRENLQGFLQRTGEISYGGDPEVDPTFEDAPDMRVSARDVKRAWAQEADHGFMESVTKIHWMKNPSRENLQRMLSGGRDEISAMGYISGPYRSGPPGMDNVWGKIGLVVQGRTTIAANSMDSIYSGYHKNISQDIRAKYSSSGLRKRPIGFSRWKAEDYILDAASFYTAGQGENEFIVAGWRVVAVVLTEKFAQEVRDAIDTGDVLPWQVREWTENFETIRDLGIPYLKRKHKNLAQEWLVSQGKA